MSEEIEEKQEQGLVASKPNFFQRLGLLFGNKEGIVKLMQQFEEVKASFEKYRKETLARLEEKRHSLDKREKGLDEKETDLTRREEALKKEEKSIAESKKILDKDDPEKIVGPDQIAIAATTREVELRVLQAGEDLKYRLEQMGEDEKVTGMVLKDSKIGRIQQFQAEMLGVLGSYISRDGVTINKESREAYKKMVDTRMHKLLEEAKDKKQVIRAYITELFDVKHLPSVSPDSERKSILEILTDRTLEAMEIENDGKIFTPEAIMDRLSGPLKGTSTEYQMKNKVRFWYQDIDPRSFVPAFDKSMDRVLSDVEPDKETKAEDEGR